MDGDGREQGTGRTSRPAHDEDDDAGAPLRPEGRGEDRHGGGAMATDRSDKAVENQSTVKPDDYSGSSESGV